MYKKVCCICKVVVLLIKPIFVTFSLPLPSSDVKIRSDRKIYGFALPILS